MTSSLSHDPSSANQDRNIPHSGSLSIDPDSSLSNHAGSASSADTNNIAPPPDLAFDLVDHVRRATELSYPMSKVAVATVLSHLKEAVPTLRAPMDQILLQMSASMVIVKQGFQYIGV